jgi:hypothetical protein
MWKTRTHKKEVQNDRSRVLQVWEAGSCVVECKEGNGNAFYGKTTVAFTVLDEREKQSEWILDSGSLIHVCNQKEMFEGLHTGDQGRKLFGIAGMIEVAGYGDVKIRCKLPNGEEQEIKLKDVAFVPEARVNLISMSCLTRKGVSIQIERTGVLAKLEERLLLTAKLRLRSVCC